MAKKVNLDALIQREDMYGGEPKTIGNLKGLRHEDLKLGHNTFAVLRKPDFQRATSSWTPEKVRDMVVAYVNGELIPSVILWRSPKNDLFVIDGAHRLSSLIAWVNDDYGDGPISRGSSDDISQEQKDAAQLARQLVLEAVGPYETLVTVLAKSGQAHIGDKYLQNARNLVYAGVQLQELIEADPEKAEKSFFKINEQGVVLSETEKLILHSRACPNSIATRAVSQRGTGYPHWKNFTENNKRIVEDLAKEVYSLLYEPPIQRGTIKTSNLPLAGNYSSDGLGLLFNVINLSNKSGDVLPKSREEAEKLIGVDTDGARTITYLQQTKRIASTLSNRMDTDFMRSLDLHPFVYFYAENGRHQPSMFLAVLEWIRDYDEKNLLLEFTRVRAKFEDFLIKHRYLIPQISRKARGEIKAVHKIKEYLDAVVDGFRKGTTESEIVDSVIRKFEIPPVVNDVITKPGKDLTPPRKSARYIAEDLLNAKRCSLCKARVPDHGISFDHIKDKKHGGLGLLENADMVHHFCNGSKDVLKVRKGEAKKLGV